MPAYPPRSFAGAWLSTHECLKALKRSGHNVRVVARYINAPYKYETIFVQPVNQANWLELAEWGDVLVTHEGDTRSISRAFFRAGLPHVLMYHGGKANNRLRANASLVVFNTKAAQEFTDCPSIVVHPPVWTTKFKRTINGRFITLINCSHAKGIGIFEHIARRLPQKDFLTVDGGYAEQIKLNLPNVKQIPTTPNINKVYAETRILLMPSLFETYGRTGVEAMSCGIPVLAHPTAGLKESLGSAGIFIHRNDIDSWVREIIRLDSPQAYRAASDAAVDYAKSIDTETEVQNFVSAIEGINVKQSQF